MGQFFRTSTPMADWRSFKFTHSELGVTYYEGYLYKIHDTVGVLFLDIQYDTAGNKKDKEIVYGDEGVLVYHIEKVMVYKEHATGDAFLPGDKVYWSGVQGDPVTPNYAAGYYWIGICVKAAVAADLDVMIDLKGDKASITQPL